MKIMFVVHRMHPNLTEVRNALVSAGHGCIFVVAGIGASEPPVADFRIVLGDAQSREQVAREIIDREKPDLIVQRIFGSGFLSFWRIAQRLGIPCVRYTQDPHQIPFRDSLVRPLRVFRLLFDNLKYRVILGIHQRITPVLCWGKPGGASFANSSHIPFPAECEIPRRPVSPSSPTVLTVAKHGQGRKRVSWLLRALGEIDIDFNLVIAGSRAQNGDRIRQWKHRKLESRIRGSGFNSSRVRLLEDLDRDEMKRVYKASDLFVLPAKREPMAISPLEALSHGIPVLVSSDGGAASYVRPFGSEMIFRSRSYGDFRLRLRYLLARSDVRERISEAICPRLSTNHSPKAFVKLIEELADTA